MTEIGFYHLQTAPLERALPRLLTKAREAGMKAVVMTGSEERAEALNATLWNFDPASFLAHGTARDGNAERQPIYLTASDENPAGATLLVCTDGIEPASFDGYERCLDIFDGNDEEAVTAARTRWTRLKEAGHDLTYWQQTERGGWEKKG